MQPSPASKSLQRYLSTLYQCIITDPSIAEVLSTEILNVQCTSESVLLVGIQNAVHDNHKNLQALGGVLQKISGTAKLGSNILNEYGKCISCITQKSYVLFQHTYLCYLLVPTFSTSIHVLFSYCAT